MKMIQNITIDNTMNNYQPMSIEMIHKYVRIMRSDDERASQDARDKLVAANYGLCMKFTNKWYPRLQNRLKYSSIEDVFQVSIIALLRAIDKYDLESGYALTTFAGNYIDGFIQRYAQDHSGIYRIPAHLWSNTNRTESVDVAIDRTLYFDSIYKTHDDNDSGESELVSRLPDESSEFDNSSLTSIVDQEFWSATRTLCSDIEYRLLRMKNDGVSIVDICAETGISNHGVVMILERALSKATGKSSELF